MTVQENLLATTGSVVEGANLYRFIRELVLWYCKYMVEGEHATAIMDKRSKSKGLRTRARLGRSLQAA